MEVRHAEISSSAPPLQVREEGRHGVHSLSAYGGDSVNRVALYSGTGNINYQGTAATNGFVWVTGGNNINVIYLHNNRSSLSFRLEAGSTMTQWPHVFLPCAKGDTWVAEITAPSQTQASVIYFIPCIGG